MVTAESQTAVVVAGEKINVMVAIVLHLVAKVTTSRVNCSSSALLYFSPVQWIARYLQSLLVEATHCVASNSECVGARLRRVGGCARRR